MFQKIADVPVTDVQKVCPECGVRLIAVDQLLCDYCKAAQMKIKNDSEKDEEENHVL